MHVSILYIPGGTNIGTTYMNTVVFKYRTLVVYNVVTSSSRRKDKYIISIIGLSCIHITTESEQN